MPIHLAIPILAAMSAAVLAEETEETGKEAPSSSSHPEWKFLIEDDEFDRAGHDGSHTGRGYIDIDFDARIVTGGMTYDYSGGHVPSSHADIRMGTFEIPYAGNHVREWFEHIEDELEELRTIILSLLGAKRDVEYEVEDSISGLRERFEEDRRHFSIVTSPRKYIEEWAIATGRTSIVSHMFRHGVPIVGNESIGTVIRGTQEEMGEEALEFVCEWIKRLSIDVDRTEVEKNELLTYLGEPPWQIRIYFEQDDYESEVESVTKELQEAIGRSKGRVSNEFDDDNKPYLCLWLPWENW